MKRTLILGLLLLATQSAAQTPTQTPTGVKSQTATATLTLTNAAGDINLIADSFCENSCSANPKNDSLTVSDSLGSKCAQLVFQIVGNNEVGAIWQCNVTASGTNTITSVVSGNTGTVHNALSISVWKQLPAAFAMAIGASPTSTPGAGWTIANGFNGSSVTAYTNGAMAATFTPMSVGGIVSYSFAPATPPKLDTLIFHAQLVNCAKCDGTDYTALASASVYQGASFTLSQDGQIVCKATFDATAQATCPGAVNIAPAMVNLTTIVTSPAGTQLNTGQTASFPSSLVAGAVGGKITLILGFDAATMTPRAVQLYSQ